MKNGSRRLNFGFLIFWGSFGAIQSSSPKIRFLTKNSYWISSINQDHVTFEIMNISEYNNMNYQTP
ncbi:hypothetical protein MTR_1g045350 [Medicago truncatula]|uniref:Uncharacterized protein n=1 Tax=Medicago truncatula TaxID=3880 RepID=G7I6N0_MEDTR|nr:hypothetical protein MTR_1g045350 [Medicago truncatula]